VYLLESAVEAAKSGPPRLSPVKVRIGITDGAFSEVLEGLKEGDVIVTGANTATTAAGAAPEAGQNNPFAPRRPPRR
jgi:hypothetical protein